MKLQRLWSMGFAEIAFRGRQEASKWADRVAPLRADVSDALALARFRDAAPRRFFAGPETWQAGEVLTARLPGACRDIVAEANGLSGRRFDLLGYQGLSFGDTIDWHLDPVANRRAPFTHWSRLNPLDPASVGDSKVTWELNRHQWLVTLAQAYWLTDDRRYAQDVACAIDDWTRANPYGIGINWASSLEVAYRLIAWSWALVLIRDTSAFSPDEFAHVLSSVRTHANHVEKYLSTYFSPNTHLTGEALGLFYAGVLFPEFPEAARWRELGRQILIDESRRQVLSDGVYFERATCYHRYTIEIYLHFLILASRSGIDVPRDVRDRVEQMLAFLLAVAQPDGAMPEIGDADGGWLLPLTRRAPHDCRGVLAVAAAWFGRADCAWAARGLAPEVLWLLGTDGQSRFEQLDARPPAAGPSQIFPVGGYAIMRSGWERDAHQLIMDVGPLGDRNSGGHAHADLLSLQCAAFGEPYLVDPGTYCYTADLDWRDYFRSTAAHSTVTIDGLSQAEPNTAFGWQAYPAANVRAWRSTEAVDFVDADHDAYARLADPVTHRRRVLFVKPRYWVVIDDLIGQAQHQVELRFQFGARAVTIGPGLWVAASGRRGEGLWIAPFSTAPLACAIREGQVSPTDGWVSSEYGRRQPAPAVVYAATTRLPVRIVTLLLPVERLRMSPPKVDVLRDGAAIVGLYLADSHETIRFDDETLERVAGQLEETPCAAS